MTRAGLVVAVVLLNVLGGGCARAKAVVRDVAIAEAKAQLDQGAATALDANEESFRAKHGWLPNAVLLSSYDEYALSELPADKDRPLIFYCSNRL